jgi:hypothetical protein
LQAIGLPGIAGEKKKKEASPGSGGTSFITPEADRRSSLARPTWFRLQEQWSLVNTLANESRQWRTLRTVALRSTFA